MTRPTTIKPDNFFLLLFNAVRYRRIPLTLRIASHSLLLVGLALIICAWVMGMQFRNAMQQQADAIGQSLVTQTAASATELLVANDMLSLNVLLSNLNKNPLVAHAAIYSVDNRTLAEAGTRPKRDFLGETDGLYSSPITFQEVIAGHLRVSLDMQQFNKPMSISMQSMGLLGGILLLLALYLSLRLGRNISTPLLQLRAWLRDPDDPAPGAGRQDEIGDIARHLQNLLVEPREEAVPLTATGEEPDLEDYTDDPVDDVDEPTFQIRNLRDPGFDSQDDDGEPHSHLHPAQEEDPFAELRAEAEAAAATMPSAPSRAMSSQSALLAVQMGAQDQLRRLPRARLMDLLQRYRDCLEQIAELYQGSLHTLNDGSSLLLFDSSRSGEDYLTHALCCGELMRALGHALQIEVADSGITLQLQLGLTLGENLASLDQGDLLLSDSAHNALALSQHSRNLLLVDRAVADDPLLRQRARIRSIASPEGACCVERLLEPYPALLERQLARLHESRT
ncbi:AhpA/YtjB family protein [Pseudomonas sp. N040]|uniref:AhpA/YtjB family protein n=1 Tax=Pseudomonas sp. N040 TaxID=2785325 RepID=UPI0018A311EB|nr:AhpA/YtjB family protein [Pseudomonas sp. N040]MBF7730978.1 histidine kinase [Pseudomonas sp. N040]MBW7014621.1 histidine kinase [Pseudomonas sp. N040]